MFSKRVHDRSQLALQVAAAAEEWSQATVETLDQLLSPYLREGESLPDTRLFQQLLGRVVADRGQRLVARDAAVETEERSARYFRARRDEEAEKLRELLRAARYCFDQAQGRGSGAKIGLGHGLSWMAPSVLARLAVDTAIRLEKLEPAKKRSAFLTLPDTAALAAEIRAQGKRLDDLLRELLPPTILGQAARHNRRQDLEDTDFVVRRCSALLGEIYKLCGRPGLAKKIKPVFRRKPRKRQGGAPPGAAPVAEESGLLAGLDWSEVQPVPPRGRWVRGPRRKRRRPAEEI